MNDSLFDVPRLVPVAVETDLTVDDFQAKYEARRIPVLLRGDSSGSRRSQLWTTDYLKEKIGNVTTQKPDPSGVNVFSDYDVIPFSQFADEMSEEQEHRYIGAVPVMGSSGKPFRKSEFLPLVPDIDIPSWFDKRRVSTVNLWIGGGSNRTLLHFDPWHSIIEIVAGVKRFAIFEASLTPVLRPYPFINFGTKGGSLDSMINGKHIQSEYLESIKSITGYLAELRAGDRLFVPAGFWHYVESESFNIAVNFFFHSRSLKEKYTQPILMWRVKHIIKAPGRFKNKLVGLLPRWAKDVILFLIGRESASAKRSSMN